LPRQSLPPSEPEHLRTRRRALGVFTLAALPTLLAIWAMPWFVTQDGPAHLYNAHIVAESLRPDSPFRDVYEVRWLPFPNWAGHLAMMGLMAILPARTADRVMMTFTFVGFAASVAWLRWCVAGWRGMPVASAMAVLLALNVTWLLGFTSFLIGACLFPVTLGVWWGGRARFGAIRALVLAALLVAGYFSHLVSLGLTMVGLVVLALTTPGPNRGRRGFWTVASLVPTAFLGLGYRRLMKTGGEIAPSWNNLKNPWSLASWSSQFGWIDPITLGSKVALPFVEIRQRWYCLLAPVVWSLLALFCCVAATVYRRRTPGDVADAGRERRGWAILGALLLLGGICGPDTLGPTHGNYLPQRLFLLGLVSIVPFLEFDGRRKLVRAGGCALAVALTMQSATVWHYALDSDRLAGTFMQAKPFVGQRQRVGTLLVDMRGRFRSNPLLHIDCMLGVNTGNIIWNNYETSYYYFPVQLKNADLHPPASEFEAVAMLDDPDDKDVRAERWNRLLASHHRDMDVLVVWGADPQLDAINARWFEPRVQIDRVRVLRHRVPRTTAEAETR
jgi:hypothetical protein